MLISIVYIISNIIIVISGEFDEAKRCTKTNFYYSPHGEVIINGMFPMRNEFPSELNVNSLLWSEVMKYTIDESNKALGQRPVFGYVLYDTCGPEELDATTDALLEMLLFNIPGYTMSSDICLCWEKNILLYFTLGIVGPAISTNSVYTNKLLRFEDLPLISYASTSPELSDKTAYPNFYRTVLPDTFQAKFIKDILNALNWTYISIVATDSSYGRAGKDALVAELGNDICIAASETLYLPMKEDKINATLASLSKDTLSNVIVIWASYKTVQTFFEHASRHKNLQHKIWIISEATGRNSWFTSDANKLNGTFLHINQVSGRNPKFENYFFNLNYTNSEFNPWLRTFFHHHNVNETSNSNKTLNEFRDLFETARVGSIQNAVLTYVNAYLQYTSETSSCNSTNSTCYVPILNHNEFSAKYISKTRFKGLNQETVEYDSNGDITTGWFDMYISRKTNLGFHRVAQWSTEDCITLVTDSLKEIAVATKSQCSDICSPGTIPIYPDQKICCWKCIKCPEYQIKASYGDGNCTECSIGQFTNNNQSACITLQYYYIHHDSNEAIIIYVLSSIGIITTLTIITIFIIYKGTPIVRSTNREMTLVQHISHLLLFLCPLLYIHEDTKIKCVIRTYSIGSLFVLITTITLVKLVHIVGVFKLKHRLSSGEITKRKTKELLMILITLVIEACIIIIMLQYKPISIRDNIVLSEYRIYKECDTSIHFIVQVAYIVLLQLSCGIEAFLGRKLPAKYNEAKYMSFAMFSSTLTMVVAIPLANSIKEVNKNQLLISVIVIVANVLVMTILYGYKIMIICFFPKENTLQVFQHNRMQNVMSQTERRFSKLSNASYAVNNGRYSTDYGISPFVYKDGVLYRNSSNDSTNIIWNPNINSIFDSDQKEETNDGLTEQDNTLSDQQELHNDGEGTTRTLPSNIIIQNMYAICEI